MLVRCLIGCWLLLVNFGVQAAPAEVQGVRVWAAPDNTRVVLDVSGPVEHSLFTLQSPDRVVIDLPGTAMQSPVADLPDAGLVARVRNGVRNGTDLRLVLDLKRATTPKSFLLAPNGEYGHRLVIDLADKRVRPTEPTPVKTTDDIAGKARPLLIAIDAGHGGEDPGARGKHGTNEKDVTLAIARKLEALVNREPGMRAIMVRDGDYYIRLRDRIKHAHERRADLFVSIHADAFTDRRVHGSSVYVVSRRGASSEMARILAQRENAADLVGGVSLGDKDDLLKSVLLDLSQNASIEASSGVAENVLGELKQLGKVHKSTVQRAGFVVLKSPDIPSILVETAFISNPSEEKRLRSSSHQQRMAEAILKGVRAYFRENPPPGTLMARLAPEKPRKHVIRRGDTLSEIARRYDVSLRALKLANGLRSDQVRVGEVLQIPSVDS